MRVEMTIQTEGATTTVSREYEPELIELTAFANRDLVISEKPALADVTQAVAAAAVIAHRITPKE